MRIYVKLYSIMKGINNKDIIFPPAFAIITLGCKVNQYESEKIVRELHSLGFVEASDENPAVLGIVNTCAVTAEAARKSRQAARKLKRQYPEAKIFVLGCAAQIREDALGNLPSDMIFLDNTQKESLPEIVAEEFIGKNDNTVSMHHWERVRAYLKVQDGCNSFCSYCIIPYLRGRSRSRAPGEILEEMKTLEREGRREVVLTGIHLGDYGRGLDEKTSLAELVNLLAAETKIPRIRLSSLEPMDFSYELLEVFRKHPKICRHLHLPLQHASDRILKLMNRKYSLEEYNTIIKKALEYFPDMSITTDVMVGFHGERDEDFEIMYDYIERTPFLGLHCFPYSPRKGTRAAEMPQTEGIVTEELKRIRLKRILALGKKKKRLFLDKFNNRCMNVLFEQKIDLPSEAGNSPAEESRYLGHTGNFMEVFIDDTDDIREKIIPVHIVKRVGERLYGKRSESICG